jgi:hypothetical protein
VKYPQGGVILLPMIGCSSMIPGGDMIGIHDINIVLEYYSFSKGGEIIRRKLKGI